jgi:two-component system cell cycle response regulator DivK
MQSGQVLVVDDYADSREMLTVALEAVGYVALTADNGWRALVQARRHSPAAIVMDLFMPEMDGIEATRRLKSDADTRDIPVIAYTARASADGLELFDGVCLKPCSPDRLVRVVGEVIARATARLRGSAV